MERAIRVNEGTAALRRLPVFLKDSTGNRVTDSTGLVVKWRKPGAGADTDVSSTIQTQGNGHFYVELTQAQCDTVGLGWLWWTGSTAGAVDDDYEVQIDNRDVQVANAVWDEANMSAHRIAGSFGDMVQRLAARGHQNVRLDNFTYGANAVATGGRWRAFSSKTACNASVAGHSDDTDGEIYRGSFTAVDAGSGEISGFKMVDDL